MEHAPNPGTVEFLRHLYAGCDRGWLTLFSIDRDSGARHTSWAPVERLDDLAATAARLRDRCVWLGVATRRSRLEEGKRGGAGDCELLPALWVDIDVAGPNHATANLPATLEDGYRLLRSFPVHPTVVVHTGGGLQAWWFLAEALEVGDVATRELLVRWGATWARLAAERDVHIDNVFDVPRIMRLPGTRNHKTLIIDEVRIERADWGLRYGLDDLDEWLDAPPAPPVGAPIDRIPYIGPERPGDAYNAAVDPGALLVDLGFEYRRQDSDGTRHYRWPQASGDTGASVYADGHITVWSETFASTHRHVELRRPYDPFGFLVATRHGGDWRKATSTLRAEGYGAPPVDIDLDAFRTSPAPVDAPTEGEGYLGLVPVDWSTFWNADRPEIEWDIPEILPRGRQAAIWASHKTGKSLFTLDMVAALASGRPVLGRPPIEKRRVVYLDMEMTEQDLHDRLSDLDYDETVDLAGLFYFLLPALPALDTEAGGATLEAIVKHHEADLVVIDTMSRVVEGEENSADTFKGFYRHTGIRLKRLGVSLIRIDHGGKDDSRGQRGSSAKGDDVDIVWQLSHVREQEFALKRKAARMSGIPETVKLLRRNAPLRHTVLGDNWPAGTAELARQMDEWGLDAGAGERVARRVLKEHDVTAANDLLRAAIRHRKQRPVDLEEFVR